MSPSENRWYTNRVQNNVPIFDIDSPLKPGRVNKDETKCTQLEQPAACADLNTEDSKAVFCGSCLERQFACVCQDTAVECLEIVDTTEHKDHDAGAQLAPVRDLADECQVPDVDISDIAAHPLAYDAIQRLRQHRKDNKRRKWERLKNERSQTMTPKAFDRGATAVETMMSGLRDFYNDCAAQHDEQASKLYQTISHRPRSYRTFTTVLRKLRFLNPIFQDQQGTEP